MRFICEDDPASQASPFDRWYVPTTGNVLIRSSDNTRWILWGNTSNINLGSLSTEGGILTGDITGDASGIAQICSPDFQNSATIDGISMATMLDLAQERTLILNNIDAQIKIALNQYASLISPQLSIKVEKGSFKYTTPSSLADHVIPLPTGIIDENKCVWLATMSKFPMLDGSSDYNIDVVVFHHSNGIYINPATTRNVGYVYYSEPFATTLAPPEIITYLIIGIP